MELQSGECPEMVHSFLDALCQRERLVGTRDNDDDLPCGHDSTDADGESHLRHLRNVIVKEPTISNDRVVSQGLDACLRLER